MDSRMDFDFAHAKWQRVPCQTSACPWFAVIGDKIAVHDDDNPEAVAVFTLDGFRALVTELTAKEVI